ncbi:MAG: MGMT family protein [Pseudomonadota bacterium]
MVTKRESRIRPSQTRGRRRPTGANALNATPDPDALTPAERIWQVVAAIPKGKVATYGQVAELAGLPRGARQVGRTLSQLPSGSRLPWHRVLNAKGELSFPRNTASWRRQRDALREDGVELIKGRLRLSVYRWEV